MYNLLKALERQCLASQGRVMKNGRLNPIYLEAVRETCALFKNVKGAHPDEVRKLAHKNGLENLEKVSKTPINS